MNNQMRALAAFAFAVLFPVVAAADGPFNFYSLTSPCRLGDTRGPAAVNGGPYLDTSERGWVVRGYCGVPATAKAVALNVTVVSPSSSSWLTIWPAGQTRPFVSTINFDPSDVALANGAIVALGTGSGTGFVDLSVANAIGTVHVIIDVTGYFQ